MAMTAGKYWSFRRLADEKGFFKMTAVDQRPPIMNLIKQKKNVAEASYEDVAAVKNSFVKVLAPHASAMLMDPIWAWPTSHGLVSPRQGLVITLEAHDFSEDAKGRRSANIPDWSVAKIKAMGADAVKVLAWYRPDGDPETCRFQQEYVKAIGDACRKYDICFLFELLVYPLPGEADQTKEYTEHKSKQPMNVINSVKEFADPKYGIDIFKLESPIPAAHLPAPGAPGSEEAQDIYNQLGKASPVPWVMLSAGANMEEFRRVLHYAYKAGASGYLAGRAIWLKASQHFPDLAAMEAELGAEAVPYMQELNALTDKAATPWFDHASVKGKAPFADCGPTFYKKYQAGF